MSKIRLNKYLSSMGLASRRKIDEFTLQKRITINGKTAVPGDKVDPETDTVIVDKKIIPPRPPKLVYYALNKPKFVVSTVSDTHGRQTVMDFVPSSPRVFPVGRLDYESTGLIMLTNDGNFANRIIHPRYHLPKTYLVTVRGQITPEKIKTIKSVPANIEAQVGNYNSYTMKITLYQGKKRQIRRLCADLHLYVIDLHRVSIGPIELQKLAPGQYRELTSGELQSIRL